MGRIRMKIFIRNESDATLTFARDEIESGDYTPGWNPPSVINPGDRKGFQGEGDFTLVPTTGTEGRVWYNIVAPNSGGELYINWNSPLIESPYDNTFHIFAPPGWEVSHWGGQGHEAELEIRLRRTARRSVPNFHARGRGFAFSNTWSRDLPVVTIGYLWNKLFDSLPGPLSDLGIGRVDENWLPITHANEGLCGGMVYAVMDYYAHHLLPPNQKNNPSTSDDPLFKFLKDRLWDSFDVTGEGHRFLAYSSPHYPNGDEGVLQIAGLAKGRSWVTYREEWPRIQEDIDAGRLSPMALVRTDNLDIGANHQVLAYAYEKSGQDVTLYIYDPNINPDQGPQEVKYEFSVAATNVAVDIRRTPNVGKRILCFFRINGYEPKSPPNGRRITSMKEAVGASLTPPYSVRNAVVTNNEVGSVKTWMRSL